MKKLKQVELISDSETIKLPWMEKGRIFWHVSCTGKNLQVKFGKRVLCIRLN